MNTFVVDLNEETGTVSATVPQRTTKTKTGWVLKCVLALLVIVGIVGLAFHFNNSTENRRSLAELNVAVPRPIADVKGKPQPISDVKGKFIDVSHVLASIESQSKQIQLGEMYAVCDWEILDDGKPDTETLVLSMDGKDLRPPAGFKGDCDEAGYVCDIPEILIGGQICGQKGTIVLAVSEDGVHGEIEDEEIEQEFEIEQDSSIRSRIRIVLPDTDEGFDDDDDSDDSDSIDFEEGLVKQVESAIKKIKSSEAEKQTNEAEIKAKGQRRSLNKYSWLNALFTAARKDIKVHLMLSQSFVEDMGGQSKAKRYVKSLNSLISYKVFRHVEFKLKVAAVTFLQHPAPGSNCRQVKNNLRIWYTNIAHSTAPPAHVNFFFTNDLNGWGGCATRKGIYKVNRSNKIDKNFALGYGFQGNYHRRDQYTYGHELGHQFGAYDEEECEDNQGNKKCDKTPGPVYIMGGCLRKCSSKPFTMGFSPKSKTDIEDQWNDKKDELDYL